MSRCIQKKFCMAISAMLVAAGRLAAQEVNSDYPPLEQIEQALASKVVDVRSFQADVTAEMATRLATTPNDFSGRFPAVYEGQYRALRAGDLLKTWLSVGPEAIAAGCEEKAKNEKYLSNGYVAAKTDFVLGHLMHGIASKALGRDKEASDHFNEALSINPRLKDLVARLQAGDYNTILIVSYGLGPRKIAYGPDNALAMFVPWPGYESSASPLICTVNDKALPPVPIACDVNKMAQDHMWNNLEDLRLLKSAVGRFVQNMGEQMGRSNDAGYVGLAVQLAGLAIRASAHADTRYCEVMPQRCYLAPLMVTAPQTKVSLRVRGRPESEMILLGLNPPAEGDPMALHYVHLTPSRVLADPDPEKLKWATASEVLYANDAYEGDVTGGDLPYILGGRCVCRPSEKVLARYQAAGNLTDMTMADLENLYRAEGIKLSLQEEGGRAGKHVLEGGNSLECPVTGSAGFKRLFCQLHAPYVPKTPQVQALKAQLDTPSTQPAAVASVQGGS